MSGQSPTRSADRIIAALAARQHGVVSCGQLLAAGVSEHQIDRRLRTARLHELHRGVYLVGHTVPPPLAIEQTALLACGNEAVLSHRTAANVWDLLPYPASAPAWVTIPPEQKASRRRLKIHRATVDPRDVRRRDGLALTSPPRTILDLAAILDLETLEQVAAEAHYRRLASEDELRNQLHRNPGKRGAARLAATIGAPGGPRRTRSPAERQVLRLLRENGITGYETNARIHGYEVDLLWRDAGLVVEVDGYDAHSGRTAFERDRLKHATLIAHGLRLMPVTGRQIRNDSEGILIRLRQALKGP